MENSDHHQEAKERLRRVFLFLKERSKLDSPVERTIDAETWQLRFDYNEEPGDIVLEVRRPAESSCPLPGLSIKEWLAPGWDKLDAEVTTLPGLEDDPRRATSFLLWKNLRDEWRQNEVPKRRVIAVYEHLFALRARVHRESERYRILLGDGWLQLDHPDGRISHPLLLQELELELEERLPALRLRIAGVSPELNTALLRLIPEVNAASIVEARELVENKPHDPHNVRELIGKIANLLFPNAAIADELADVAPKRPTFVASPIVFLGSRAGTIPLAADRFIESLEDMKELPAPLVDVVLDQQREETTETDPSPTPLFTLPANREQEEILRRLQKNGSVVVQGPPGTGKTHTIANLIGHFLAEGKTVLVTSHTAKALRVVRDKVVPELQPLCVAYLESDLRGREQLESSVNGIVARLSRPESDARAIARVSKEREQLVAELSSTEQELDRALAGEQEPIVLLDRAFLPREAGEKLRRGIGLHDWLPGPISAGATLPLTVAETAELYRLQAALPVVDEVELTPDLPVPETIADSETYSKLVRKLTALENDPHAVDAAIFKNSAITSKELQPVIDRALAATDWLGDEWLERCLEEVSRGGAFLASWDELRALISEALDAHETHHAAALRHELLVPELDVEGALATCDELIEHLDSGGGLGWFARIGRSRWVALLDGAKIDGRSPSTREQLEVIRSVYQLRACEEKLRRRWAKQMVAHGVIDLPDRIENWPQFLESFEQKIARARLWWSGEWAGLTDELTALGVPREKIDRHTLKATLPPALDALKRREKLAELREWERELKERLSRAKESATGRDERPGSSPFGPAAVRGAPKTGRVLAHAAKTRDVERYAAAFSRLLHLTAQQKVRAQRKRLLDRLRGVSPGWARAIETRTPPHDVAVPPGDVEEAWLHVQLMRVLSALLEIDLDALQKKIVDLRERLHQKTAELVACKAWAKQVERTSPTARRNLTGWLDYQKQIGKGTGKRAPMLQRRALELLSECKDSVPVWIMPLSKVIESYDLAKTRFDVVIIDEASQCDVNGLFAFGLARQIVVVGDDQQVSPLAVGQELDPIQTLIDLHLDGIPNKDLYTGRLSIYDLARQSQSAIRLREHFRCVPEIISFSSRLAYEGEIQALREGTGAKLLPAVIEHHVAGKCDDRNVNMPEAIEVAALVASCIEQPEYDGATMGVIGLLGDEQWAQIERFLHAWLEPKEIEKRRLLCGAPAHFQGDERDVIIMSAVWSSTGTPLHFNDNPEFKKRLNVAASRARDQMWVVHSMNADVDLKPDDLRRRLIDHARNPRALLEVGKKEGRAESELETRILELLQAKNFRVEPRVQVGTYRLDLVVEGERGRVAIECGADREQARRRQLERLGWKFIRVRASQFALDPERTIDAVVRRLHELGIAPAGPVKEVSETLHERVVRRAAELRQAIWDRLGEQETLTRARPARKSGRPSKKAVRRENPRVNLPS